MTNKTKTTTLKYTVTTEQTAPPVMTAQELQSFLTDLENDGVNLSEIVIHTDTPFGMAAINNAWLIAEHKILHVVGI